MKEFDATTYQEQKGDFNNEDEELLVSLLGKNKSHARVLDIGCGDGALTKRIKESISCDEMVAIDNSAEQISLATKVGSPITFLHRDVVNFSPEEKFDIAYSFYAFPHIPKSALPEVLSSVRATLKDGGTFYLFTNICLFDTAIATAEDQEACDIVFLENWPSQINLVSLEEMKKLLDRSGFKEVENRKLKTGAQVKNYGEMVSWLFIFT